MEKRGRGRPGWWELVYVPTASSSVRTETESWPFQAELKRVRVVFSPGLKAAMAACVSVNSDVLLTPEEHQEAKRDAKLDADLWRAMNLVTARKKLSKDRRKTEEDHKKALAKWIEGQGLSFSAGNRHIARILLKRGHGCKPWVPPKLKADGTEQETDPLKLDSLAKLVGEAKKFRTRLKAN